MRSGFSGFALLLILAVFGVLAITLLFTVGQTQQALVMRFGEPVAGRGLITEPGLHVKWPFIENVIYIDKRILDLEVPQQEVTAADNQRLEVDAFVRYRITDPLKFFQTLGTVGNAGSQLSSLLSSSLRRVLGEANLPQIVREERAALMLRIRDQVNDQAARYGMTIEDVRIRRADLPREISEGVFARMRSERQRETAEKLAEGSQQSLTIRAKADRDVVVIKANAQRQADETRGAGEAERIQIFADAFGKDPEFAAFYRSMRAYDAALKPGTKMVLSPKLDFFRFFSNPEGQAAK
ncbi:protease modulator HflC [Methylovirgula sp. 4M-Z18]|uniref:protease modulator HflC n=1 Tax=Methylovirgula sp. 4M-Z18 TaxID=2293567 RepID=UPI000E2E4891|nr:protease modulator HflC [Methylovirgula sp. 4M-Z18]RFB75059.1 protease modulator HflC [Methylovirgula sp. 4M-Z18]